MSKRPADHESDEPRNKMPHTDSGYGGPPERPAQLGSGGGSSGGDGGGGGQSGGMGNAAPIPLARDQHSRKVDKFTVKYSGTTYIPSAHNGTKTNIWAQFPWEHYVHAMQPWTARELSEKYQFWKALS